jgi:hypothetical protein
MPSAICFHHSWFCDLRFAHRLPLRLKAVQSSTKMLPDATTLGSGKTSGSTQ